jgi:hypothetical protein
MAEDETRNELLARSTDPSLKRRLAQHTMTVAAVRRQAAAPPLYLLLLCILPTFTSVFIASSRWFDFRHHGFDILFGFLIGVLTAFFSFRYYHLPVGQGAGWAWGPRSRDKAFWAGIGSFSYATDHWRADAYEAAPMHAVDEEAALSHGARTESRGRAVATATGAGPTVDNTEERTSPAGRKSPVAAANTP